MKDIKKWCIENTPPPKAEGRFFSYAYVQENACGFLGDKPGNDVRAELEDEIRNLILNHDIAIQLGVKSNGVRGIRIFNLK